MTITRNDLKITRNVTNEAVWRNPVTLVEVIPTREFFAVSTLQLGTFEDAVRDYAEHAIASGAPWPNADEMIKDLPDDVRADMKREFDELTNGTGSNTTIFESTADAGIRGAQVQEDEDDLFAQLMATLMNQPREVASVPGNDLDEALDALLDSLNG